MQISCVDSQEVELEIWKSYWLKKQTFGDEKFSLVRDFATEFSSGERYCKEQNNL